MASQNRASFKVEHGLSDRDEIFINKHSVIAGNSSAVDVRIDNQFVSRRHFQIRFEADIFYISDLGSTNGTYLDGVKLAPNDQNILRDGAKVGLAHEEVLLTFSEPGRTTVRIPNPANEPQEPPKPSDLLIDSRSKTATIRGKLIPSLPKKEFDILECLFQNRGSVVTRDEIAAVGWPERPHDVPNADIDQYIRRLHRKIEEVPSNPRIITTRVGYGYLMP